MNISRCNGHLENFITDCHVALIRSRVTKLRIQELLKRINPYEASDLFCI